MKKERESARVQEGEKGEAFYQIFLLTDIAICVTTNNNFTKNYIDLMFTCILLADFVHS